MSNLFLDRMLRNIAISSDDILKRVSNTVVVSVHTTMFLTLRFSLNTWTYLCVGTAIKFQLANKNKYVISIKTIFSRVYDVFLILFLFWLGFLASVIVPCQNRNGMATEKVVFARHEKQMQIKPFSYVKTEDRMFSWCFDVHPPPPFTRSSQKGGCHSCCMKFLTFLFSQVRHRL